MSSVIHLENKKEKKISKKLILILVIVVIIILLIIIITNIIFSLNKDEYKIRSYACCGELPPGMTVYAPCGCSDENLTIWQKTILVLRGK